MTVASLGMAAVGSGLGLVHALAILNSVQGWMRRRFSIPTAWRLAFIGLGMVVACRSGAILPVFLGWGVGYLVALSWGWSRTR